MLLKTILKYAFALAFIAGGVNHFLNPKLYLKIMPPYLPWHLPLVYISGVAEVVLGAALLIPALTPWAAWGLIALLVAIFPANLYMAMNAELFRGIPPALLWLRLPLQGVLIAWAYWYTR